jgi:antitoxin CptB
VVELAPAALGRLRWRCRRGMKELDVLLSRWVDRHAATAAPAESAAFDRLLELQDPELARYLLAGDLATDPDIAALVARLRDSRP